MGIVYEGKNQLGQKVVIKEPYFKGEPEDAIRLEKLRLEAKILSKLNHKNIVRYLDECNLGNTFYLVLEFVQGSELLSLVNPKHGAKRPFSEDETVNFARKLLEALGEIHRLNIIHRDVNPKNILKDSEVTLIDFGAAKDGYDQVLVGGHTIVGTPVWSAPEQFRGLVTPQCDIYGVGSTMFFLITGDRPNNHMGHDGTLIRSPKDINPSISAGISQTITKAMSLDPTQRFQLAEDMIRALDGQGSGPKVPSILCLGMRHPITGPLTIGRQNTDIVVPDQQSYISRNHVKVYGDSGRYWIEDQGSTNGTFILKDGIFQRIDKQELKNNDLIALCFKPDKGPYITISYSA